MAVKEKSGTYRGGTKKKRGRAVKRRKKNQSAKSKSKQGERGSLDQFDHFH
jgi:hypothetical protein